MPRQAQSWLLLGSASSTCHPYPTPPKKVMGLLAHFTGQDSKARHLTMSCGEWDKACEPEPAQIHQRGKCLTSSCLPDWECGVGGCTPNPWVAPQHRYPRNVHFRWPVHSCSPSHSPVGLAPCGGIPLSKHQGAWPGAQGPQPSVPPPCQPSSAPHPNSPCDLWEGPHLASRLAVNHEDAEKTMEGAPCHPCVCAEPATSSPSVPGPARPPSLL